MLLLLQEVDVSGGNNSHQLPAHFAVVCDGNAAEAVASFGLEDVPHTLVGTHHHRVCDEALLITLEREGEEGGRERRTGVLGKYYSTGSTANGSETRKTRGDDERKENRNNDSENSLKERDNQEMKETREQNHTALHHHHHHHRYLDFAHFVSLELWSAVVVNEANAARQLWRECDTSE